MMLQDNCLYRWQSTHKYISRVDVKGSKSKSFLQVDEDGSCQFRQASWNSTCAKNALDRKDAFSTIVRWQSCGIFDRQQWHRYDWLAENAPVGESPITKNDGTHVTSADKVGLVNLSLQSLWSDVQVYWQNRLISSGGLYPYKAYLNTLLNLRMPRKVNSQHNFMKKTIPDSWMKQTQLADLILD